ncbi:MAG TPA: TIGR01841 family phasin [Acidisoma sp.]|uniref:phasin family protein n=1 Tax=Acidisoma sp. TaxID=1872115 RepID=UPI002C385095|nr:TIGR01841 family phasin [Acidisoma sp.]HTI03576.1 TIGR01841 family phasin [Acidisoma sp.]
MSELPQTPTDFTKFFSSFSFPAGPEMTALMETQKRNLAALAAANKLLFEGAQAITQRQMEVMRRQMTDVAEATRSLTTVTDPKERTVRQTEMVKTAYEKSVADLREIEDLLRKSSGEALDLIHGRFLEAMDEVKGAVERKTKPE